MKFRTDFVTNSSDSSFLTFNIKNKKLFEALTGLGIKFKGVNDGKFSDSMRIELPSGETAVIFGGDDGRGLPFFTEMSSISAWLVATILWEVGAKEEEYYSDFARELIDLLNEADITHLDWEAVETWSREAVVTDFEKAFGVMDGDIEEAKIEHMIGFEGEVENCLYTEIKDGKRMTACYDNFEVIDIEDCAGLNFAVTGKLKFFENREEIAEFIENAGGSVTETVSKDTDYLICNDIRSNSSKMKKAKELGIAVLPEEAFIRKFVDPEDIDDLTGGKLFAVDDRDLGFLFPLDDLYERSVLDVVFDSGIKPIFMEVWKDGKWVRHRRNHGRYLGRR